MAIVLNQLTKVISITAPQVQVGVQELVNEIRDFEDELPNLAHPKIIDAVGKADLGGGVYTGIVLSLNTDWQIQFYQGSGVSVVDGGTIVGGVGDIPIKATGAAGDITILQNPVNSTITSGSGVPAPTVQEIRQEMDANSASLNTLLSDTDFLIKIIKNSKALLKAGSVWELVILDDDDVTPILSKAIKDKDGNDITDLEAGVLAMELKSVV